MNKIDEYINYKTDFDNAKNHYEWVYSNLWLNTDWEKEFGKKPSIKDKEQWIKEQKPYRNALTSKQEAERKVEELYLKLQFQIHEWRCNDE